MKVSHVWAVHQAMNRARPDPPTLLHPWIGNSQTQRRPSVVRLRPSGGAPIRHSESGASGLAREGRGSGFHCVHIHPTCSSLCPPPPPPSTRTPYSRQPRIKGLGMAASVLRQVFCCCCGRRSHSPVSPLQIACSARLRKLTNFLCGAQGDDGEANERTRLIRPQTGDEEPP